MAGVYGCHIFIFFCISSVKISKLSYNRYRLFLTIRTITFPSFSLQELEAETTFSIKFTQVLKLLK